MDLRPDLPRITAPTLVLAGAEDPATPPSHAETIAALVPHARLEVLAGAGHLATVQDPGAATALLVDHLGGAT
jgi:pimeloyl-ACP methyl ester carboxylesterase